MRGWFTLVAASLAITGCAIGMVIDGPWWVVGMLVAATVVGSVFPAQRAWQSIKRGSLDINVLMVIAVMGAMAIREYEEAAMVVTLFAAGSGWEVVGAADFDADGTGAEGVQADACPDVDVERRRAVVETARGAGAVA